MLRIAIDGTAGSGKGTLAKNLKKRLSFPSLDTGKLYRIVSLNYIKKYGSSSDIIGLSEKQINKLCKDLDFINYNHALIMSNEVSKIASKISKNQYLRNILNQKQREFANNMSKLYGGCILDGRDIGTVIIPNAEVKFFITACIDIRAKRRLGELYPDGLKSEVFNKLFIKVKENIKVRDHNDTSRKVAPLKKAKDALEIDTTELTQKDVLDIALKYISKKNNKI